MLHALALTLALSAAAGHAAQEPAGVARAERPAPPWPELRGPFRDGRAPAGCNPPVTWGEGRNVRWKTAIHGRGWSTPVVGEGRVWLTTADPEGHHLSVMCLDLESGAVLLDRVLFDVDEPAEPTT